jgi:hypothetical protein
MEKRRERTSTDPLPRRREATVVYARPHAPCVSFSLIDCRPPRSRGPIQIALLDDTLMWLTCVSDPVLEITAFRGHELRDLVST